MFWTQRGTFRSAAEGSYGRLRMFGPPVGISGKRFRTSAVREGRIRAGLAIGRGSLATAARLDAESAGLGQELERAVEGATVRLVAEHLAHVTTRERLGQARE